MRCKNCEKDDIPEGASFCHRCGKQCFPIFLNRNESATVESDKDDKKIRLQIYQIGLWIFLTMASLLYVAGFAPKGDLSVALAVLIICAISAVGVIYQLNRNNLPK